MTVLSDLIRKKAILKFKDSTAFAAACDLDETTARKLLHGGNVFTMETFFWFAYGLEETLSSLIAQTGN